MGRTQSRTLSIELGLLGFLRQGAAHGYALHQALAQPGGLGTVWQIKLSQLYALLGKLEDAGYVTATLEPQQNKPPRKIFELTEEGACAFLAWVQRPVRHGRALRLEFLVKLYFARQEGADVARRLLAAQRRECDGWLVAEQASLHAETAGGRQYSALVHQFRQGQIQAMLSWLDQCEAT